MGKLIYHTVTVRSRSPAIHGQLAIQSCCNCRTASLVRSGHARFRIPIRLRSFVLAPVYVCMYPEFLRALTGYGHDHEF